MLKCLESTVGARLKKAHLRTHKLKDDLNIVYPAYFLDNIEYGGEPDFAYETKKLINEFSEKILKPFPPEK
jgi:hypothetical protein